MIGAAESAIALAGAHEIGERVALLRGAHAIRHELAHHLGHADAQPLRLGRQEAVMLRLETDLGPVHGVCLHHLP